MQERLGLATCFYAEPSAEKWRQAAAAGFTNAEIDVDGRQNAAAICQQAQQRYDELTAGGLRPSSLHLPFGDAWDISTEDAALSPQLLAGLETILRWARQQDIRLAVLHASFEPIPEARRSVRLALAKANLQRLAERAAKLDIRLAVEDLPRSCLGNCSAELEQLTQTGLVAGVCFDVNHLLKESHQAFVGRVGRYILTTHLSDYDRIDERHWFPGEGCIDWPALKQLLRQADYRGRWLFELNENAAPSLGRPFTPAELAARFNAY